jgi:hypothetical protein
MVTSPEVYSEDDVITIVFDKGNSHEALLIRALRETIGNAYVGLEVLDEHCCCVHLRRGELRGVRR